MARQVARGELAARIDELVGSVDEGAGQVEIMDRGRVIAVISRPSDRPRAAGQTRGMAAIKAIRLASRGADPDEVMAEVTVAVETFREARYRERHPE